MPINIPQINIPTLPQARTLPDIMALRAAQGQALASKRAAAQLAQAQAAGAPAQTALRQAQTQLAIQRSGQLAKGIPERFAPGAAGQVQGEKAIEKQYGVDSPEAKRARLWNDTSDFLKKKKGDYYGANLILKHLPTAQSEQVILEIQKATGKPIAEIRNELSGNIPVEGPTTQPAATPLSNSITNPNSQAAAIQNTHFPTDQEKQDNQQQVAQTEAQLAKQVGSSAAQKALPPLLDITKTINKIDFSPVAKFSGLHGKAYATLERGMAALNLPTSPEFKKYDLFVKSQGKLLADSTRQALQTSVRSGYVKSMLMPLTNTSVWYESPELAMNRFNFFRNWLNDRTKMFHYLATKGISPNAQEMNKTLGIGKPPPSPSVPKEDPNLKSARSLSNEQLLRIAKGGQ